MKPLGTATCTLCHATVVAIRTDDQPPRVVHVDAVGLVPGVAPHPKIGAPCDRDPQKMLENSPWLFSPVLVAHRCQIPSTIEDDPEQGIGSKM